MKTGKAEKGTRGYLDGMKRSKIRILIGFVFLIAVLLAVGSAIGGTAGGFVRMAAVLLVIPSANVLVNVVATLPFRSLKEDIPEASAEGCRTLWELAVSREDGPSVFVPCAVIGREYTAVYAPVPEDPRRAAKFPLKSELAAYLERRLRVSSLDERVTVCRTREELAEAAAGLTPADPELEDRIASALLANSF